MEVNRRWGTADHGPPAASARRRHSRRSRRTLRLLVRPVDANGARTEPFPVHGSDSLFRVGLVTESEKAVSTGLARVHIPHNTGVGKGAKGAEGLPEDLIVDLRAEVADKNVEMVAGVLLVLLALISPVDADLGIEDLASVERLKSGLRSTHVHVLDEAIVETAMLVVSVGNDLYMLHGPGHGEDLGKHILRNPGAEVANVKVSPPLGIQEEAGNELEQRTEPEAEDDLREPQQRTSDSLDS